MTVEPDGQPAPAVAAEDPAPPTPDPPQTPDTEAPPPEEPAAGREAPPPEEPAAADAATPSEEPAAADAATPSEEPAAADAATPGEPAASATSAPEEPAGESAPPEAAPDLAILRAEVDALAERAAAAERRADELTAIARRQAAMADELHAENKRLREGEVREAVAPLVRGLARLADDLDRMGAGDGHSDDLRHLAGRVEELLHDAGALPLRPQPGEPFDPRAHQAVASAATDDPHADRTIAGIRRAGLRRDDGRVLRPADVVVHRFTIPTPPEDTTA